MHKSKILIPASILVVIIILALSLYSYISQRPFYKKLVLDQTASQPAPKPQEIKVGDKIKVKYPQDYTLVLLGDSMTERLGNSDELRTYLKKYYPNKTFEVLNYGFGSTNILSAQERLEKETFYGRAFRPILDIVFDLILIESFGHNPLSEYPLEEGLKKQTEALDKMVKSVKQSNPEAKIIFVATISPNKRRYAEGITDLDPKKRQQWAEERIAYIENHISYAESHDIPIINIFEKSLNRDGDGNTDYISTNDFIHPSPNGIYLISEEIAKFIFTNKVI